MLTVDDAEVTKVVQRIGLTSDSDHAADEVARNVAPHLGDRVVLLKENSVNDQVRVAIDDETDEGSVTARFSQRDSQAGFAVLLRQCHSETEPARFGRVADILWQANERDQDASYDQRRTVLHQWRRTAGRLQQKSLDQLMREKMASEEGMKILDYPEEHTPAYLLSAFNYGDLLHWDHRRRAAVAGWQSDDYEGPRTRLAFLASAAALAHVYVGFGELASTATAP